MSEKDNEAPAKDKEDSAEDKKDPSSAFHYTSKDGYKGILKSGKIKASVARKDDDVTYGANKTYFTALVPEKNTPLEIAENNYGNRDAYAKSKLSSTEIAIKFNVKDIGAKPEPSTRSIQTVEGDVDLSKSQAIYEWEDDQYKLLSSKPEQE